MPLPYCCTCDYWYKACCRAFCLCCPVGCEYGCFKCMFDFFGVIYCFSKLLSCILYGPYKFIKSILNWLCCGFKFFLLLLAGLLALFAFLYRTFCSDISNILNVIFVDGFGLGLLRFALTAAGDTWNTFAPRINTIVEIFGDIPRGVQEVFYEKLGTVGTHSLFNELSSSSEFIEKLIAGIMIGLLLSDPSRLERIADETPELLQVIIDDIYENLNQESEQITKDFGVDRGTEPKFSEYSSEIEYLMEVLRKYPLGDPGLQNIQARKLLYFEEPLQQRNIVDKGITSQYSSLNETKNRFKSSISGKEFIMEKVMRMTETLDAEFKKKFSKDGSCSFFSTCKVDENSSPDKLLEWIVIYYENSVEGTSIKMPSKKNRINRQLLVTLPPPLDCLTNFPFDPTCILDFFPITPPTWLQPFIDFTCSCPGYVDTALPYTADGFNNFLLVLKTIITAFSSIPFISTFLATITLPSFIQDNLFLGTPGTLPTVNDLLCALFHADYFLAYAVPGIIIAKALLDSLAFIPHCFKTMVELQLLRYLADLIEKDIFSDYLGESYDRIFEKEGKRTLQNPQVFCHGTQYGELHYNDSKTTSIGGRPTKYYRGVSSSSIPLKYDPINQIRRRTSCNDSFNAQENKTPLEIEPPFLVRSEIGDFQQRKEETQKKLKNICDDWEILHPNDINRIHYMCFPESFESPLLAHHGLLDSEQFLHHVNYRRKLPHFPEDTIVSLLSKEFGDMNNSTIPNWMTWRSFSFLFAFHPLISVSHSGKKFQNNIECINRIPPGKNIPVDLL